MADTQTNDTRDSSRPGGAQRSDVPYRWPRGPEAPSTPTESRARHFTIGLAIIVCIAAAALIWMMVETRW